MSDADSLTSDEIMDEAKEIKRMLGELCMEIANTPTNNSKM